MKLVTTVALAALRGPLPLAKALSALDVLSDGRVIAGVGPGSSQADYDLVGVPFGQRWQRFDETLQLIKAMLQPADAALRWSGETPGRAPQPGLGRLGGRVRRAAVPLCPRGVPARPLLAGG